MRIPCPSPLIQTWAHRQIRTLVLITDVVSLGDATVLVLALITPLVLASDPATDWPIWGWLCVVALAIVGLLTGIGHWRKATRRSALRLDVINTLLHSLHDQVFDNSPDFRFTYFIRDPVFCIRTARKNEDILVPLVRRESGQDEFSRCYYPLSSNAVTAKAWKNATRTEADLEARSFRTLTQAFPRFRAVNDDARSRRNMEQYYRNTLRVDDRVLERISDYMIDVVEIISIPIADYQGNPVGLLSIDCRGRVLSHDDFPDDNSPPSNSSGHEIELDVEQLACLLGVTRNCLIRLGLG